MMLRRSLNTATAGVAAVLAILAGPGLADPVMDDALVINGEIEIATDAEAPAHLEGALGERIYSGWRFRDTETRAMQKDDFDNPMFLFVDAGLEAWDTPEGSAGKSCADCHGDVHAGQFKVDGQTDCARCHTSRVDSFLTFNHDRDSRFALGEAHASLDCAACHKPWKVASGVEVAHSQQASM